MLTRLGNVLYWLGIMVAVVAILGAVSLNGVACYKLQEVERSLIPEGFVLEGATEDQQRAARRADERLLQTAINNQDNALIFGGVAVLIGLAAYGFGWTARYVLRGPS